ncbi:MAG TPA: catalase, partial [Jatrophihabitans sp.]|nr:catalase [Jatrophihabitans sp.]
MPPRKRSTSSDRSTPRRAAAPDTGFAAAELPSQTSEYLTTAQGLRLPDTDHSLKAGDRGPTLLEDFHFREKITHFDHERIPERVVHARGTGAHGVFQSYGNAASLTRARFLAEEGKETPVFVRFSTVIGSRGSADTVRDVRGFATKFYTDEGVFDLVGNNMPVFFIQDAIKFPDVIHAAKWHPDTEIPQAQTAHDTFWDFVSLHTEATHHVMWAMSDRAIPRSYRTMEGFGVHTFRLVNADGEPCLVKFHWKPVAGVHSLVWEEAQLAAGMDPDFHRRDLVEGIDSGAFLEWELGVQVMPDDGTDSYAGIDLLDPTKIVPEELVPVQLIGRMTLNRNTDNFFAETEQVAFHLGNLVPGIEPTNDPLFQGRLFSYLDTQLNRFNSANFAQLPINRTHAPVNDMLRDGFMQMSVHRGIAPYQPNSLDGGAPKVAPARRGGYEQLARPVAGDVVRRAPVSFADHFSQAALFYRSLTPVEQQHLADAMVFELGKCYEKAVRGRWLGVLADVDTELCEQVAAGLGMPAPKGEPVGEVELSPALAQITEDVWPIAGRRIGVLADPSSDLAGIGKLREAALAQGVKLLVISAVGGELRKGSRTEIIERTFATTRSIEYDALLVAGGTAPVEDVRVWTLLQEAYRHGKPLGAWGSGSEQLTAAGIPLDGPGVLTGPSMVKAFSG